jgi:hypothetical protein
VLAHNGGIRPKADLGATGRDGHVFYVRIRSVDHAAVLKELG